jgi:AraC-like DNA-binding protein
MISSTKYFKYLPVSNQDRDWGVYLLSSGLNQIDAGSPYPILQLKGYSWQWDTGRTLDDFQILLIHSGKGTFESAPSGRRMVNEGSVILLFPGVWHRYRPHRSTGWTEQWITFNGEFPKALLKNDIISPQRPVLNPGPNELIVELFEQVADVIRNETVGYQQTGSMKVLQILANVDSEVRLRSLGGTRTEKKMGKARAIMAQNLNGPLDIPTLANSLNMGYSWFRRMFKQHTGHPPAQYHLHLRINRAKHILLETDLSVKEIAYELGFDTPNHFSQAFKNSVGHSPTIFRSRAVGA